MSQLKSVDREVPLEIKHTTCKAIYDFIYVNFDKLLLILVQQYGPIDNLYEIIGKINVGGNEKY